MFRLLAFEWLASRRNLPKDNNTVWFIAMLILFGLTAFVGSEN